MKKNCVLNARIFQIRNLINKVGSLKYSLRCTVHSAQCTVHSAASVSTVPGSITSVKMFQGIFSMFEFAATLRGRP